MVAYIVHVFTIIITLLNIFFFNIEKVFCINSRGLKLTLLRLCYCSCVINVSLSSFSMYRKFSQKLTRCINKLVHTMSYYGIKLKQVFFEISYI